jgi:hypothetical protein
MQLKRFTVFYSLHVIYMYVFDINFTVTCKIS